MAEIDYTFFAIRRALRHAVRAPRHWWNAVGWTKERDVASTFPQYSHGTCPICETVVKFVIWGDDYRNQFLCESCLNYSVPRERALAAVLKRLYPNWRDLSIHESSPVDRGLSAQMKRQCADYVATQYYPGMTLGELHKGFRNENLEQSTFPDARFDLVVTQDVMEHVNDFPKALRDINRTLKPGGAHIFSTPTYVALKTLQWATYVDGKIRWIYEPEYHGNPVDDDGAPVTFHYGYDFPDLIHEHAGLATEVVRIHDPSRGIAGPMNEVYLIRRG